MSEAFHSETYRGFEIELVLDYYPSDPITEFNFATTFACFHRRYSLGHDNHGYNHNDFQAWEEMKEAIREDVGERGLLTTLYLLDHSGLALRAGRGFSDCDPHGWDWGIVGFAYMSEDTIVKEYGDLSDESLERANKLFGAEIETYTAYVSGDVYGFDVKSPTGEVLDSCFGFYGDADRDYALEAAREKVDGILRTESDAIEIESTFYWICPLCRDGNVESDKPTDTVKCERCGIEFSLDGKVLEVDHA